MRKVWYSKYKLNPIQSLNRQDRNQEEREGLLLKVQNLDGSIGFSDCHPWPEFGDLSVSDQIQCLKQDQPTELMKVSLERANWERHWRNQSESIFKDAFLPQSHLTVSDINNLNLQTLDQTFGEGFEKIKIKLGRDLKTETETLAGLAAFLPDEKPLRLDFNQSFSSTERFEEWLSSLRMALLEKIDFIEDPCFYDESEWMGIHEKYKVDLAVDHKLEIKPYLSAQVLIIKPSLFTESSLSQLYFENMDRRFVFSSYMGHPLGQALDLARSGHFYSRHKDYMEVGGFYTHSLYEPNQFTEQLRFDGPAFLPSDEVGVGFQNELESLDWVSI